MQETMRQMQMLVGVVHRLRHKASDRYWRLKARTLSKQATITCVSCRVAASHGSLLHM